MPFCYRLVLGVTLSWSNLSDCSRTVDWSFENSCTCPTQTQTCKMSRDKPSPCAGCMRVLILLLYSKLSSLCLMPNRKAL